MKAFGSHAFVATFGEEVVYANPQLESCTDPFYNRVPRAHVGDSVTGQFHRIICRLYHAAEIALYHNELAILLPTNFPKEPYFAGTL
jgi:hypothetical protein